MKNKIYKILDKEHDMFVDCFIAHDDKLAVDKIKSDLKKQKFLFDNTKNVYEKANVNAYFNNAKFYQLLDENNKILFNFNELIIIKEKKENE